MNEVVSQFFGKRSRKEEKKIQEERRQRKIRIGPNPKETRRMGNIISMMDDIYMERYMKGYDDINFKNKNRDFRNIKMIDYNKRNANYTKNFEEDSENKEDTTFKHAVDFRDIQLIKSPLIEEAFVNNQKFLEQTRQIRQTMYHAKQVLKPPKKKQFQNSDTEVNEILHTGQDLDKKKSKMQTIQERIQKISEKLIVQSFKLAPGSDNKIDQQSSRKRYLSQHQLQFPVQDLQQGDTKRNSNPRIPSIRLIKPDSQSQDKIRYQTDLLSPNERQNSPRERLKSLFHVEDSTTRRNMASSCDFKPTLLDIRRELQQREMEQKKQNLENRQRKMDDIRSKLGLVRQFEIRKDIDLVIEKIQQDLEKIDEDLSKCPLIKKFRVIQPRPLTFSKNENYKSIITNEQNKDTIRENKQSQNESNLKIVNNVLTSQNNLNTYQQQNILFDSIVQDDPLVKFQKFSQKQGFPSKRLSVPVLQLYDVVSQQATTVQSPNPSDFSTFNSNTERAKLLQISSNRQSLKRNSLLENNDNNKILSHPTSRGNSRTGQRSTLQTINFSLSPDHSILSQNIFKDSQLAGFSKISSSQIQSNLNTPKLKLKKQSSYNKEVSKRVSDLFSQVDYLQKETREQAKEETDYAKRESQLIMKNFQNWEQEFNEFNTEADKRLLKDIQEEMRKRERQIQEDLKIN